MNTKAKVRPIMDAICSVFQKTAPDLCINKTGPLMDPERAKIGVIDDQNARIFWSFNEQVRAVKKHYQIIMIVPMNLDLFTAQKSVSVWHLTVLC